MNVLPQFLEEEPEPLKEEIDEPEDDEPVSEVVSEVMPEVIKPKPRSTMEDIYGDGPIMKVVEDEVKPKKERKKRKPMTDEQKEKLAMARQKALEVRREKAKEKQELKDLQKMKKQKELNDLRAEVGLEPKKKKEPVISEPKKEVVFKETDKKEDVFEKDCEKIEVQDWNGPKYYSQADLDKATLNAIMGYETIRKDRKAKKNEVLSKKREEQRVAEQLRKVIQPRNITYGQEGYFNDCF